MNNLQKILKIVKITAIKKLNICNGKLINKSLTFTTEHSSELKKLSWGDGWIDEWMGEWV